MRFIENIPQGKLDKLKNIFKNGDNRRKRERALAILLSHKKYTINQIAEIIEIDRDSVSSWFNKWETNGIESLSDLPKSGRPSILFNDFKKKSKDF